jgi:predicted metal-binding membrane protein
MKAFAELRPPPRTALAALVGVIVVTWIVTVRLMAGMDAGPGTPLGGFGWFVATWLIMMTAMMLPSEMRFVLFFAQFSRDTSTGAAGSVRTWLFLSGYLLTWTTYGVLAYGLDWALRFSAPDVCSWHQYGPMLAGGIVVAAGFYQLSSLKQACLRHCASPLGFFMRRWRFGSLGAVRMGIEHGVLCIGCCWGLMLVLFAVGVMSLFWMSLLAAVMFAEKVLPSGAQLAKPLAVALLALGVWVAVAPDTVPFLTQPGAAPARHVRNGDEMVW